MKTEHIVIIVIIILVIALIYRDTYKQNEHVLPDLSGNNNILDIETNVNTYFTNYNINNIPIYNSILTQYNTIRTNILTHINLLYYYYFDLMTLIFYQNRRIYYNSLKKNTKGWTALWYSSLETKYINIINSTNVTKAQYFNRIQSSKLNIDNLISQFNNLNTQFDTEKNKIINDIYQIAKPIDYNNSLLREIETNVNSEFNLVNKYKLFLDSYNAHTINLNKNYSENYNKFSFPKCDPSWTYTKCNVETNKSIRTFLDNKKTETINTDNFKIRTFLYKDDGIFVNVHILVNFMNISRMMRISFNKFRDTYKISIYNKNDISTKINLFSYYWKKYDMSNNPVFNNFEVDFGVQPNYGVFSIDLNSAYFANLRKIFGVSINQIYFMHDGIISSTYNDTLPPIDTQYFIDIEKIENNIGRKIATIPVLLFNNGSKFIRLYNNQGTNFYIYYNR